MGVTRLPLRRGADVARGYGEGMVEKRSPGREHFSVKGMFPKDQEIKEDDRQQLRVETNAKEPTHFAHLGSVLREFCP